MNYTEFAQAVFSKLESMERTIARIAEQVEEIYNDEPGEVNNVTEIKETELPVEEQVKKYGQRIPYNLIDDVVDIERFREFIYTVKSNSKQFNSFELEYVDRADKNFDDVRLSSKHLQILKSVYQKLYNRPWPFKYRQGYMYKLEPYALQWQWFGDDQ
jgi:hypothetical protein